MLCVRTGTITRGLSQDTFLQEDRPAVEQVAQGSYAVSVVEVFKARLDKALNNTV